MEAFRSYLCDLRGRGVQVERSGPEACQGWLLHVGADFLTLRLADGTELHLPLHHIRSVTPLVEVESVDELPAIPWAEGFTELLGQHIDRSVRLYHAGPEQIIGTLKTVTEEYLLLDAGVGALVCYTRFHIRSLALCPNLLDDECGTVPLDPSEPTQGA